jgi:hypothetical protein
MPSPAVVSAAASAETWDRTDPFSSCRSHVRGWLRFESRVVKLCAGNPSAIWCVSFLTCADSELLRAEPDRVVDALEDVPRLQTAEAPTRAADATPRSRPTRIRKYEPALAPRYDAEWGESVDPGLLNCGRSAPPAPDSYNRAPYRPPITVPPSGGCESNKSHPTSLLARSSPLAATNSTSYPRSGARSVLFIL